MQVDWWTFLLQTVNFLVLVWLLHRFLYRPILAAIDRRRRAIEGLIEEAEHSRADAEAERVELAAQRLAITSERDEVLTNARRDAEKVRDGLLAEAHEDANQLLAESRAQTAREHEEAMIDLRRHATTLAVGLAGHVLGSVADDDLDNAFFDAALASLRTLPEDEMAGLKAAVERAGADEPSLHLVSARELGSQQKTRFLEALAALLGREPVVSYAVDDDLIAGVELHLPHTIVHHSARSALEQSSLHLDDDQATRHA